MLAAKLIHDDEDFPQSLRELGVVFAIDAVEFHTLQAFWEDLNKKYGLNISYFSDEIVRSHVVSKILGQDKALFSVLKNQSVRQRMIDVFSYAAAKRAGLVFMCD